MAAVLEGIQQEPLVKETPIDEASPDAPPGEERVDQEDVNQEDINTEPNTATTEATTPTRARGVKFSIGDVLEGLPATASDHSQSKMMAPVKPITLRIYTCLEDQVVSVQFATGRFTTAGEILSAMINELHLPEETKDVFSIWMISPHLKLQLKTYHVPVKLFKKWNEFLTQYTSVSYEICSTDKPILSFRRNAFFPLREEKRLIAKRNSKEVINLLYHEAKSNVLSGRYPFTKEELIELGSIQCAVENKEFNDSHTPQSFKSNLGRYFPSHLVPASPGSVKSKLLGKGSKTSGLEKELVDGYKLIWEKVSSQSKKRLDTSIDVEKSAVAHNLGTEEEKKLWLDIDLQLKLLYLQRCWNKPYYGGVMFHGQIERKQILSLSDRNVVVAINPECIHLFTDSPPREILLYLSYDIFSWDFQPATEQGENFYSSLWLEFDSFYGSQKVAKRVQIFSRQAPMMDAMITRCVDDLNNYDDEVKKKRLARGGPEELPAVSIKTDNALPTSKNFREDVLKCDMYTPDGEQFTQLSLFRKKKAASSTPVVAGTNPSSEDEVTGL